MTQLYRWVDSGCTETAMLTEDNMYKLQDTVEELLKEFYTENKPSSEYVDELLKSLSAYLGVYTLKEKNINI